MTHRLAMARFDLAWPLAGGLAAVLSIIVLAAAALLQGLPGWLPLNATTHALYGPEAAELHGIDLGHTGLGLVIHVVSAFFWAAVAVLIARIPDRPNALLPWAIGLGVAFLAGVVDYGLMPARLTPGWELVLPPAGLVAGLAAIGVGVALGLAFAGPFGARSFGAWRHRPPRHDREPAVGSPSRPAIPPSAPPLTRGPADRPSQPPDLQKGP